MGLSSFVQTTLLAMSTPAVQGLNHILPDPPHPEPIVVTELPLPPVAPSSLRGACSIAINPQGTGCIQQLGGLIQSGSFLPDSRHIVATVNFTGAPASPDPASIYNGPQAIVIKTNGDHFANGDPWKCITCGVPEKNAVDIADTWDYPQAFLDGKRLLVGQNIIECEHRLTSKRCTPDKTYIYPIRWNDSTNPNATGGRIRELRLHPDNVHLECNSYSFTNGVIGEASLYGRLRFNPSPAHGRPLSPRYEFDNVYVLSRSHSPQVIDIDRHRPDHLILNRSAITIAESRGFSGTGHELTYLGYPVESCNLDVFAVSLATGAVRRITEHPEYCDPIAISPDDNWNAVMDTRGSGRVSFFSALRGVPPLVDMLVTGAVSAVRNNGDRRFFQPYLIDKYGDRGTYFGQKINAAGDESDGSIDYPNWNGRADPQWSPDGTKIVYWQALAIPPACGGANPLPCESSTEPGGRAERIMLANLTSRTPIRRPKVAVANDEIPWGTKYAPGNPFPTRPLIPQGDYTLNGASHGHASVRIVENAPKTAIRSIAVTYHQYSEDGLNFLNGMENVTYTALSMTGVHLDWWSDLIQTGPWNGTKKTSDDGFHMTVDLMESKFEANGTLTSTVNGVAWRQPGNGQ